MRSGSLVWQTWYLVDTVRLAERFNMRSGSLVWQTWYSIYQFIHCFTLETCNYDVIFDICIDSASLATLFKKCNIIMT